jgi:hypothetical protein
MTARTRITATLAAAAVVTAMFAAAALAATLEDGEYTLTLPGVGDFVFTVDSDGEDETVSAVAAPDGYELDDDDPDKAAWKDAAGVEVEAKSDKIEADVVWDGGAITLGLPGGGSITVAAPDGDGDFTVTASGGWWAFGSGHDWYVADAELVVDATAFFKVEADEDGVEIKPVDALDEGFLNDLDDEEEVEDEDEAEIEVEVEDEADDRGRP